MDEPVQPGEILAQKYRVDRVLGVGGMGVVVAATHMELDRKVALKFMLAGGFTTPEGLARFHREARIAVKLRSEHVARVSDTGTLENGAPYIVMEFLEGTDMSAQLEQFGPMPVGFAAEAIVQACDAVGEAHAHGIIHRDLKPANLFLTQHADGSPLVKVLDFGISKAAADSAAGMSTTKTGAVMGSPLYMSPEQMRSSKTVDARSDVWSLGVILYEFLTGKTPFDGESFGDLLLQVMTVPHRPVRELRPEVPPALAALIDGCLVKDPAGRIGSVAQIAEALSPFCSATGVVIAQRVVQLARRAGTTGDPRVITGQPAPAGASTAVGWGSTQNKPAMSSRAWIGVAVLVLGLSAAGLGVALLGRHSRPAPAGSATVDLPPMGLGGGFDPVPGNPTLQVPPLPAPSETAAATAAPGPVPSAAPSAAPPVPAKPAQASTTPATSPKPSPRGTAVASASAARPVTPPPPKPATAPGILDTSN